jgi:hypothetical protein
MSFLRWKSSKVFVWCRPRHSTHHKQFLRSTNRFEHEIWEIYGNMARKECNNRLWLPIVWSSWVKKQRDWCDQVDRDHSAIALVVENFYTLIEWSYTLKWQYKEENFALCCLYTFHWIVINNFQLPNHRTTTR